MELPEERSPGSSQLRCRLQGWHLASFACLQPQNVAELDQEQFTSLDINKLGSCKERGS